MILIVELASATSIHAYKDRLASGFDKGLNDSMVKYEADDIAIIIDFDLMQGKVWRPLYSLGGCQLKIVFVQEIVKNGWEMGK